MRSLILGVALLGFGAAALGQDAGGDPASAGAAKATPVKSEAGEGPSPAVFSGRNPRVEARTPTPVSAAAVTEAVGASYAFLLSRQEAGEGAGPERAEWPYEGVYRVGGKIPIGYRVGGTGICAMALLGNPAFKGDAAAEEAVARSRDFVVASIGHPLMTPEYDGGYDVRGWGYTYGLLFLLKVKDAGLVPREQGAAVERAIVFFIEAIERTEIPEAGGWNYARPPGREGKLVVCPPSPFMTAPTLMALFEARARGYSVDPGVVERALKSLEAGREESGAYAYSGSGEKKKEGVPGAVGRMLAAETALYLAGRGNARDVRAAVDAFIVHWEWLDKRRALPGTHERPYSVAPYYFYYAHYFAAQAVELLPEQERAEYRRRITALLFSVRQEDGTWNDRVFPRSASYGTAMASLALMMPELPRPAEWKQE
jgi:hypothetical protein